MMYLLFTIPMSWLVLLLPFFFTGLGYVLNKIFTSKETKTRIEKIAAEKFDLINEALIRTVEAQGKEIKEIKAANEKCEFEHEVTRTELRELKEFSGYKAKLKGKVHILEDDLETLHDFKKEFSKVSIIDYRGYHDSAKFIDETQKAQPAVVIIDHMLGKETAQTVIKKLGYQPEIMIMSGEEGFAQAYVGQDVKFFVKEGKYIYQILGEVIKYLSSKQ